MNQAADYTPPTRQHELDHTDQGSIFPAWQMKTMKRESKICPTCETFTEGISSEYDMIPAGTHHESPRYSINCQRAFDFRLTARRVVADFAGTGNNPQNTTPSKHKMA